MDPSCGSRKPAWVSIQELITNNSFKGVFVRLFKTVVSAFLLVTFASSVAMAEGSKAPGSGPNPFSDCGIGAALFPDTKWAAVTSNVIWDIGTTAVTSATMSPETCSGKKVQAALFIRDTYPVLVEDVSRGSGEHLRTALNLFDCDAGRQHAAISLIRADMSAAVAAPGYAGQTDIQKSAELYGVMSSAAEASCKV